MLRVLSIASLAPENPNIPVPNVAALAGYNTLTFGPAVTMGANWYDWNWFGSVPPAGNSIQNSDGSVTLDGTSGNTYNGGISTGKHDNPNLNHWAGTAFGGGGYFEAQFSFTGASDAVITSGQGWPSFWMMSVEHLSSSGLDAWPGQPGFTHFIEFDVFEYLANALDHGRATVHDWYFQGATRNHVFNTAVYTIEEKVFSTYNKYGFLWIPATATTQGSASWYLNGQLCRPILTWNQYNPALPPPPIAGSSAYSIADVQHVCVLFGTNNFGLPMRIQSMSVWQKDTSQNWVQAPSGGGGTLVLVANGGLPVPPAAVGVLYEVILTCTNGTGPFTWSKLSGPAWGSVAFLAANTALFSGTPTSISASDVFVLQVIDTFSAVGTITL